MEGCISCFSSWLSFETPIVPACPAKDRDSNGTTSARHMESMEPSTTDVGTLGQHRVRLAATPRKRRQRPKVRMIVDAPPYRVELRHNLGRSSAFRPKFFAA